MAKTKSGRQRRKQRELRDAFQLRGVIKREPNGRASRAKRVRRVEPSPQVIKAKKELVAGIQGADHNCPFDVMRYCPNIPVSRRLTDQQHRMGRLLKDRKSAYAKSIGFPDSAKDILATLEPTSGDPRSDEALERIKQLWYECREVLDRQSRPIRKTMAALLEGKIMINETALLDARQALRQLAVVIEGVDAAKEAA